MYSIHDGEVGSYPPTEWVAQGTMPQVPMNANMVLPTGDVLKRTFPTPSPAGEASVASLSGLGAEEGAQAPFSWQQWGQDMLTQGIKDTKNIVGGLIAGSGRQSVQKGFDATWQQQLQAQQMQMQLQAQQQKMQLEAQAVQQQLALQKQQMEMELAQKQATPAPAPMLPMIGPAPAVEKKKFPTWAWAVIGVGGALVVGGAIYFFVGREKKAE